MKKKIRDNKGFTLMELMCVIGMIVILIAIALPNFDGKLEKSREAVDISNLRTAAAAVRYSVMLGEATNGATKNTSKSRYQVIVPMKQKDLNWQTNNSSKYKIAGVSCKTYDSKTYKGWTVYCSYSASNFNTLGFTYAK